MPFLVIDPTLAAAAPTGTELIGAPLVSEGWTLGTLRAELKPMLGNRSDIPQARYDVWINQAYIDVATALDIETMRGSYGFNTVVNQPLYVLPGGVGHTRGASIVDTTSYQFIGGRPLEKSDLTQYRRARELVGEPRAYFREGKVLVIWPTPKTVHGIAVDYSIRPLPLVLDTHSPIIPVEFHESILLAARQKGFAALLEFDKSMAAGNEFVAQVRRRKDELAEEDDGKIVASSVPRRARELYRGGSPRRLGSWYDLY